MKINDKSVVLKVLTVSKNAKNMNLSTDSNHTLYILLTPWPAWGTAGLLAEVGR